MFLAHVDCIDRHTQARQLKTGPANGATFARRVNDQVCLGLMGIRVAPGVDLESGSYLLTVQAESGQGCDDVSSNARPTIPVAP